MVNNKKRGRINKKIYFILFFTVLIVLMMTLISNFTVNNTYTVKTQGIKFSAPQRYKVGESQQLIFLKDESDEIYIVRHTVSSNDINEFIQSYEKDENVDINIVDEKALKNAILYNVNIQHMLDSKAPEKSYFLLADKWVYDISASSLLIYKDLDIVANSLEYIEPDGDITYQYITPTTFPTDNNWNKFKHPLNHFNFEFPSDWKLQVYKHRTGNQWHEVFLTDRDNKNLFRINFMTGGRGSPNYDYEINTEKILGDKLTNWKTMYKDDKAFEISIGFPNNNFDNKLVGLYIYLPEENQDQFIQTVEKIITTLEY